MAERQCSEPDSLENTENENQPASSGNTLTDDTSISASHDPNCIFCKICSKETRAEILFEDSDFVCFVDRKPVSTHHYLVVPRQHILGVGQLRSAHESLVQRMTDIGKQVLVERGGTMDSARLGFHWPPLVMVKHLHMHIISPVSQMSWLNRTLVFRKDSYFFSSPDYLINYIKAKPS